jgi:hypothetical protein
MVWCVLTCVLSSPCPEEQGDQDHVEEDNEDDDDEEEEASSEEDTEEEDMDEDMEEEDMEEEELTPAGLVLSFFEWTGESLRRGCQEAAGGAGGLLLGVCAHLSSETAAALAALRAVSVTCSVKVSSALERQEQEQGEEVDTSGMCMMIHNMLYLSV